jgi:hypothetical protein
MARPVDWLMDSLQAVMLAGVVLTAAFVAVAILDEDVLSDQMDYQILGECSADHTSQVTHIHANVRLVIDGNEIAIPDNVGIQDDRCPDGMRGIHTHDSSGKLHIETTEPMEAPIDAFFQIWGEDFDSTHILNKVSDEANEVVMFVNGESNSEFEIFVMLNGYEIEIRYQAKQ